jgi:hypothetical protein
LVSALSLCFDAQRHPRRALGDDVDAARGSPAAADDLVAVLMQVRAHSLDDSVFTQHKTTSDFSGMPLTSASLGLTGRLRRVALSLRASNSSRRFSHCEYRELRIFSHDVRGSLV